MTASKNLNPKLVILSFIAVMLLFFLGFYYFNKKDESLEKTTPIVAPDSQIRLPKISPTDSVTNSAPSVNTDATEQITALIESRKMHFAKFDSGTPAKDILGELARTPAAGAYGIASSIIAECLGRTDLQLMSKQISQLKADQKISEDQGRVIEQSFKRCVGADIRTYNSTLVALREVDKKFPEIVQQLKLYEGTIVAETPKNQVATEFESRLARIVETRDLRALLEFSTTLQLLVGATNIQSGRYLILDGINLDKSNSRLFAYAWGIAICDFGLPCDLRNYMVAANCNTTKKVPCPATVISMVKEEIPERDWLTLENYRLVVISMIANRQPQRLKLIFS